MIFSSLLAQIQLGEGALHSQAQTTHQQFVRAFTRDPIDRSSLETAREAHVQLADQASRRIVQLVGDVGSVLTPAQRRTAPGAAA